MGRDPRFASLLRLDQVGVYGMSAGGHTALSLAGGRGRRRASASHCDADLVEDFQSCVGLATRLTGGPLDGLAQVARRWPSSATLRRRRPRAQRWRPAHRGGRRGVPAAADFDMASLAAPRVPLGLVTAGQDRWLIPRFHSDRVLAACRPCERLADLAAAGTARSCRRCRPA